jgi:hypothetical protein
LGWKHGFSVYNEVMNLIAENRCRELLVIDNEPIRRAIEVELQTVRAAIEECEEKISRHETLDLPAFRQWMALECADLLQKQRMIEDEIWVLRARLAAIQGLTRNGINNVGAAFFWFREIEQDQGAVPPYVQRAWEEVTVGRPQKQKAHGVEVGRFEEEAGEGIDDESDDIFLERDEESATGVSRSEGESGVSGRIKRLFRKIALLLHPDTAGVVSRQELELWSQAQRAYEQEDAIALETVLARCDRVGTNRRTLSELREFVRQSGLRFLTLRESIAGLERLSSWQFLLLSPSELKTRLKSVRRELDGVVSELARDAALLERELRKIETKANRWVERRRGVGKQLALGI